jgi:hypothetical protein
VREQASHLILTYLSCDKIREPIGRGKELRGTIRYDPARTTRKRFTKDRDLPLLCRDDFRGIDVEKDTGFL